MNPIIYVDGDVADRLGGKHLQELADTYSTLLCTPLTILTHGASKFHATKRYVGRPEACLPEEAGQ